jgi:hypothetical protein
MGACASNAFGQLGSFAHCGLAGTSRFQPASEHVAIDEQSPVVKSPYSHPSEASVIDTHAPPCVGSVVGHAKQADASSVITSLAASVAVEASGGTSSAPQPHAASKTSARRIRPA